MFDIQDHGGPFKKTSKGIEYKPLTFDPINIGSSNYERIAVGNTVGVLRLGTNAYTTINLLNGQILKKITSTPIDFVSPLMDEENDLIYGVGHVSSLSAYRAIAADKDFNTIWRNDEHTGLGVFGLLTKDFLYFKTGYTLIKIDRITGQTIGTASISAGASSYAIGTNEDQSIIVICANKDISFVNASTMKEMKSSYIGNVITNNNFNPQGVAIREGILHILYHNPNTGDVFHYGFKDDFVNFTTQDQLFNRNAGRTWENSSDYNPMKHFKKGIMITTHSKFDIVDQKRGVETVSTYSLSNPLTWKVQANSKTYLGIEFVSRSVMVGKIS